MNNFISEWQVLQNQYDSYEKYSLIIKLVAIVVFTAAMLMTLHSLYTLGIIALLWLQDAIWKTFQARIETRLYQVEAAIAAEQQGMEVNTMACQFNQEFLTTRKTGLALIAEYLKQALRPTIAFPYVLLIPFSFAVI